MIAALTLVPILLAPSDAMPTRAERTAFAETARYEETLDYCRGLEKASPWIRATRFGVSPEGRDLILVIASRDRAFTPEEAARTGKPVVLIQAGIHAGEIDGKDAGLMLLRDIAVTRQRAGLLDRAVVLFMPIYNVDGHERFGPHHRINQNGPREMGWRTTARNLNLNRDYVKADAVETRAWLKVFTTWWPDLTLDSHVTDGADYQYDLTYAYESGPHVPGPVAAWLEEAVERRVLPALESWGHKTSSYVWLRDDTDPSKGLVAFPPTPRFSTVYTIAQNRPSFLIETHMLKDYATRVRTTYDTIRAFLEEVNRDPAALRTAVKAADDLAARRGALPLAFRTLDRPRTVTYEGVEYERSFSEVSGAMRIAYTGRPRRLDVTRLEGLEPTVTIDKPLAYLVPPEWTDVVEILRAHGLKMRRLTAPVTAVVEEYRLSEPAWQAAPFEGRHPVTFKAEPLGGRERAFAPGTVLVPLDQRSSGVAVHLLEPMGPDSLAHWGFFDAIFEQKEYGEAYVVERLAREMLEKDRSGELRAEFEKALADPAFAGSPARRLDFFYRRSPWWDDRIGLYPVARVTIPWDFPLEPLP